jgi:hypothetical protein
MRSYLRLLHKLFSVTLVIICCQASFAGPEPAATYVRKRSFTADESRAACSIVSMMNLIATPHEYNNKIVAVTGFLHYRFEDKQLYFCRDFGDHLMSESSLALTFVKSDLLLQPVAQSTTLPESQTRALQYFDGKYVLLIGRFSSDEMKSGLTDPQQGIRLNLKGCTNYLFDVTRVMELRDWELAPREK